MAKISGNELRAEIVQILVEAKKKKEKADDASRDAGKAANAYGFYEEVFDHAETLGEYSWAGQTYGANWGPGTGGGSSLDSSYDRPSTGMKESDERALRQIVREVMQIGIASDESAWNVLRPGTQPTGIWEAVDRWYKKYGEDTEPEKPKRGQAFEQTKYKLDRRAQRATEPKK